MAVTDAEPATLANRQERVADLARGACGASWWVRPTDNADDDGWHK